MRIVFAMIAVIVVATPFRTCVAQAPAGVAPAAPVAAKPAAPAVPVSTQLQPALKIMFITGFAAVALNAQKASPNAKVLEKPVHLREIVTEVERLIAA